jgi:hypothetical protein
MNRSRGAALLQLVELRAGSVIAEREIRSLKRRWSPVVSRRLGINPAAECDLLLEHGPYRISDSHAARGRLWWRQRLWTPKGMPRATQFARDCPRYVWEVTEQLDYFELVDWEWHGNGYGMEWPYPVIRAVSASGIVFDYVLRPWQSGGVMIL